MFIYIALFAKQTNTLKIGSTTKAI